MLRMRQAKETGKADIVKAKKPRKANKSRKKTNKQTNKQPLARKELGMQRMQKAKAEKATKGDINHEKATTSQKATHPEKQNII